jgi:hypothetical protein
MASSVARRRPKKPASSAGFAFAVVAALGWAIFTLAATLRDALSQHSEAASYSYIAAYNLLPAIAIWVVLCVWQWRSISIGRGLVYLAAIWLIASTPGMVLLPQAEQQQQEKIAAGEIRSTLGRLIDKQPKGPPDTHVKAHGDAGEAERLVKQMAAELSADRDAYRQEVEATGFPGFLQPSQLRSDPSMRRTRAKLRRIREIIAKYRALQRTRMSEFRAAVSNAPLSESVKRDALAGLDRSLAEAAPQVDREWDLEDEIIGEYDEALALLARRPGRWTVMGGRLAFADRQDLDAFNAHLENARRMGAEQQAIQDQAVAQVREGMQQLERYGQ